MKKLFIVSIGCLSILMSGCSSSKELKCTMEQDAAGNTVAQNMVATFSGDKITKVDMEVETKLADEYVKYIDMFVTQIDSQFESYKGQNGIETKTTKKDNSVVFNMTIDVDKLDDESKDAIGIVDVNGSYKESKKALESAGYTCK